MGSSKQHPHTEPMQQLPLHQSQVQQTQRADMQQTQEPQSDIQQSQTREDAATSDGSANNRLDEHTDSGMPQSRVKKIEVCVSNLDLGSDYVCDLLEQTYPAIKVRRWGCLGYCHLCFRNPAVLIDDAKYIQATAKEELWQKVRAYIAGEWDGNEDGWVDSSGS